MESDNSFVASMDEGVRRAREGNFAFIGESVSLDLAVARHCDLVRAHEVIGMRGYSIVAPLGKTTNSRFDQVFRSLKKLDDSFGVVLV